MDYGLQSDRLTVKAAGAGVRKVAYRLGEAEALRPLLEAASDAVGNTVTIDGKKGRLVLLGTHFTFDVAEV